MWKAALPLSLILNFVAHENEVQVTKMTLFSRLNSKSRNGEEDLITPQIYQIVPLDFILDICRSATPRKEHRPILHIFNNKNQKLINQKVGNFNIQLNLTLLRSQCVIWDGWVYKKAASMVPWRDLVAEKKTDLILQRLNWHLLRVNNHFVKIWRSW